MEIEANLGPFEAEFSDTWYSIADMRLAMNLAKMNTSAIDDAVDKSIEIYKKVGWKELSIGDRCSLGDALVLAGHHREAYEVLSYTAESVLRGGNREWSKWVWWQAGWAAWMGNDRKRYESAFDTVLTGADGKPIARESWNYSEWISAFILDKVTLEEFQKFCSDDPAKKDDPYFFLGEKLLREKEYDKAVEAYTTSVEIGEKARDMFASNRARWRLKSIQKSRQKEATLAE